MRPTLTLTEAGRHQTLEELKAFLRIPSISAQPEHKEDVRAAAEWLKSALERAGLEHARLIEGEGHPLVAADWLHASGKPTVLFYGHYDVQPPDPLDEWQSAPFEPELRGENLYARGAADDKGPTLLWVKALEALIASSGELPVNVRVLCEGEEESNGEHIAQWLDEHASEIPSDAVIVCDTEMFAKDWPSITVGLRGIVYVEIEVRGARADLHSGQYGGTAPNAVMAAAEIVTALKDRDGCIRVNHFFDDVIAPSEEELAQWAALPFDEEAYLEEEIGSTSLTGEPGYSVLERVWARPTLEVHGIRGGYTGEGSKTVIPARATIKLSCRLVPGQIAGDIVRRLEDALKLATPAGVTASLTVLGSAPASLVDPSHPCLKLALETMSAHFPNPASFIRSGGAIPIVGKFQSTLKAPCILFGFGLPDDNLHAPNEKFYIPNFWRGMEVIADYLRRLAIHG
ncbi:MAG: dipeptidase [Bryobacterales bacterium]|nr:dipeptidase [Bryobacterales bacterium]